MIHWYKSNVHLPRYWHCVALILCLSQFAGAIDPEAIYRQNVPATVIVNGEREDTGAGLQGSGVCVDTRGYVLVTAHQANGIGKLEGRLEDGTRFHLAVVTIDTERDMALLKADTPLPAAVSLGDATTLENGASIVSIATPINLSFSTVVGSVSAVNRTLSGFPVLQANLTATHGSSGGPVFDGEGRLVGLIRGELEEVAFTIVNTINNAYPLLADAGVSVPTLSQIAEEEILIPSDDVTATELKALEAYNRGVEMTSLDAKRDAYTLAVTLLPAFFEAWFNLGVVESGRGDTTAAVAAYARAQSLRSDDVRVWRNTGRLQLLLEHYDDARQAFERARDLAPADAQSHNDLGVVLRQMGDNALAEASFNNAIETDARYASAHYNLALCLADQGKFEEAQRHLERFLELDPNATDAPVAREHIEKLKSDEKGT